jgi:bacteriocin-like protein
MNKINHHELQSITGGYCFHRRNESTSVATVAQILTELGDLSPDFDESAEVVTCCYRHSHQPATPKNGDRNSQGQIYSWGTWWDDTH